MRRKYGCWVHGMNQWDLERGLGNLHGYWSLWWFQSFARLRLLKENPCQQVREILVLERRTAHYWLMVGPSGSSALEENVRNLRMFRMECVQHTQVLLSH